MGNLAHNASDFAASGMASFVSTASTFFQSQACVNFNISRSHNTRPSHAAFVDVDVPGSG